MRELLDFERSCTLRGQAKEEAIRRELGIPPARYFQLLGRVIDTREALEYDPVLVHRLQRLRDERRARQARRVARKSLRL